MTKTIQLDLQKRILIVEFPEGSTQREIKRYPPDKYFHLRCQTNKTEQYTEYEGYALFFKDFGGKKKYPSEINLICKGDELTEEILIPFLEFFVFDQLIDNRTYSANVYKDYRDNGYLSEAIDSFISAIEAKGWNFGDNPEKDKVHITSVQGSQDAHNRFLEAESKTLHPDRVLICEIV